MITSHVLHYLLSLLIAIASLVPSRFTWNSFRRGTNHSATNVGTSMRNYYKSKRYEFTLRGNFSDRARLEHGRKMKTEKAEEKREAVSALPPRPHRATLLERGINLVPFFLFLRPLFLPSNKIAFTPNHFFSVSTVTKLFVIMSFGIARRDGIIITRRAMNLL